MSPLLRRLGVTRRRSVVRELEHALEVAETDRDIARAEKASAYEALGRVAAAAGRPGAPYRWYVADLVDWVTTSCEIEDQRDTLGAQLVAVDEALAAAGVDWTNDRAVGIRDLDRLRRGGVLAADGVVDATVACGYEFEDAAPGWLRCCALPDGHATPHQPALDPWCSADLDGARCSRPAGHTEHCRPVEPPNRTPVASLCLRSVDGGRWCVRLDGHDGDHEAVGPYHQRVFRAPAEPSPVGGLPVSCVHLDEPPAAGVDIARCGARNGPDFGHGPCHQVAGHGGRHQDELGYEWDTGRRPARRSPRHYGGTTLPYDPARGL